ncbi:MAG: CDP-alcohol phosphatidyltransferase family protein [Chitinivibrionales bacterium]|nr:CDP-alcohol phosphatidyltransferase family protein [Chitinivibrionales bacterium]MBD3394536.1 CDP-alcohol phosphatidyltransferase family protein [Chitinivibrionales bacterium]
MINRLRPLFNAIFTPPARLLNRLGVHPNVVTAAGIPIYAGVCWLLATGRWRAAVALGVATGLLDVLDGVMARESGKQSRFGAVLDSTCDRLVEILVALGLAIFYLRAPAANAPGLVLCFTMITGSLMVSYVRARAEGAGIQCKAGLMQRADRLVVMGVALLAGPTWVLWAMGIVAVLSYVTVVQRLIVTARNAGAAAPASGSHPVGDLHSEKAQGESEFVEGQPDQRQP